MKRSDVAVHGGFLPSALPNDCLDGGMSLGLTNEERMGADAADDDDDFGLFMEDEEEEHGMHTDTMVPLNDDAGSVDPTELSDVPVGSPITVVAIADESPSLSARQQQPQLLPPLRKSSMKRNSSYGSMEILGEMIPINTKRSAWKTLPVPKGMTHSTSTASFFQPPLDTSGTPSTNSSNGSSDHAAAVPPATTLRRNNVSFTEIHVRDYGVTVGDHPNCAYGTPLSLDWSYSQNEPLCLDQYEAHRPKRRTVRQMHLNSHQRTHILNLCSSEEKNNCNNSSSKSEGTAITAEEMKLAKRQVKKVQRQRAVTAYLLPVAKLEDAVESAARKTKRLWQRRRILHRGKTFVVEDEEEFQGGLRSCQSMGCLREDETIRSSASTPSLAYSIQTI